MPAVPAAFGTGSSAGLGWSEVGKRAFKAGIYFWLQFCPINEQLCGPGDSVTLRVVSRLDNRVLDQFPLLPFPTYHMLIVHHCLLLLFLFI